MTSIANRIRRQRRIVDAMRRQLTFEILVLERLEGRTVRNEPRHRDPKTLADILERALRRSRALPDEPVVSNEAPMQGD